VHPSKYRANIFDVPAARVSMPARFCGPRTLNMRIVRHDATEAKLSHAGVNQIFCAILAWVHARRALLRHSLFRTDAQGALRWN